MYIADASMVTPLGNSPEMTAAAIAAGISAADDSSFHNKAFEPISFAEVPPEALPDIDPAFRSKWPHLSARHWRMQRLCQAALPDTLINNLGDGTIAVFLAAPETTPFGTAAVPSQFLEAFGHLSGIRVDQQASRLFPHGRPGALRALESAMAHLAQTGATAALVGGVDTYWDHLLLAALDANDRIAAPGVSDGFKPGEAAGFLLITPDATTTPGRKLVRLSTPGFADEPGHLYSDAPYAGEGLWAAAREALNTRAGQIEIVISSMNGEHYWAKELGVTLSRNVAALIRDRTIEHPADCFGDVGAAFAAVALGLITTRAPGNYLVCASADGALRGAVCCEILRSPR